MKYKLQKNSFGDVCSVTIIGEIISIPFDQANTDYQAYLKWVSEGGVVLPADEPNS
jgi:Tfp pilus assembly protein PilZ